MVLASQTVRGRARRHSRFRRRRRRRAATIALGVGGLGLVTWLLLRSGDDAPAPETAPPVALETAVHTGQPPPARTSIAEQAPQPRKRLAAPPPIAATTRRSDPAPRTLRDRRAVPPPPAAPPGDPNLWRQVRERLEAGLALADPERPLESRRWLTDALASPALAPDEAQAVREALAKLNQRLLFSPEVVEGDPFCLEYMVEPGEILKRIVRAQDLRVDWRFILRINGIADARRLRQGQRLKLVTGPFHAVVSKPEYRLDLYLGTGPQRVYVGSFAVGLGTGNSTPIGLFRIKSKVVDPSWTDPRTNQVYSGADPANPIGEHWLGFEGIEPATKGLVGYGLHGTIEPETIGTQASMGCIRMLPRDVELIYEVLVEQVSTVEITP